MRSIVRLAQLPGEFVLGMASVSTDELVLLGLTAVCIATDETLVFIRYRVKLKFEV